MYRVLYSRLVGGAESKAVWTATRFIQDRSNKFQFDYPDDMIYQFDPVTEYKAIVYLIKTKETDSNWESEIIKYARSEGEGIPSCIENEITFLHDLTIKHKQFIAVPDLRKYGKWVNELKKESDHRPDFAYYVVYYLKKKSLRSLDASDIVDLQNIKNKLTEFLTTRGCDKNYLNFTIIHSNKRKRLRIEVEYSKIKYLEEHVGQRWKFWALEQVIYNLCYDSDFFKKIQLNKYDGASERDSDWRSKVVSKNFSETSPPSLHMCAKAKNNSSKTTTDKPTVTAAASDKTVSKVMAKQTGRRFVKICDKFQIRIVRDGSDILYTYNPKKIEIYRKCIGSDNDETTIHILDSQFMTITQVGVIPITEAFFERTIKDPIPTFDIKALFQDWDIHKKDTQWEIDFLTKYMTDPYVKDNIFQTIQNNTKLYSGSLSQEKKNKNNIFTTSYYKFKSTPFIMTLNRSFVKDLKSDEALTLFYQEKVMKKRGKNFFYVAWWCPPAVFKDKNTLQCQREQSMEQIINFMHPKEDDSAETHAVNNTILFNFRFLTKDHVPMLENFRREVLEVMRNRHTVNKIIILAHYLNNPKFSSLHFHILVNHDITAYYQRSKSWDLNRIIAVLKSQPGNISDTVNLNKYFVECPLHCVKKAEEQKSNV